MKHYGDITNESKYKVYRYIFPNGKTYIGVTKNEIHTRRDQGYQHNIPLKNALKEVGWKNVRVEILENHLAKEDAFEKEKDYIRVFESNNPQKGFNISRGGKSTFEGLHHSQEHKAYMSNLLKGRVFSSEHKKHLKESQKKKAVIRIDCYGNEHYFESLHDAARSINGHPTNVNRACQSGKIYKQYFWSFKERG